MRQWHGTEVQKCSIRGRSSKIISGSTSTPSLGKPNFRGKIEWVWSRAGEERAVELLFTGHCVQFYEMVIIPEVDGRWLHITISDRIDHI